MRGGNVVTMGEACARKLDELRPLQPIGIEIGEINFQPEAVDGRHQRLRLQPRQGGDDRLRASCSSPWACAPGLSVGLVLFLTILATILVMYLMGGILLERISLGAFIIALCMLTDNAIVITEGIKVGIEGGRDKIEVIRDTVAQNQWPLFGATAIAVVAFAAIGLSEDNTGEYCNSLFWVIFISLTLELGGVGHGHAAPRVRAIQADGRRRAIRTRRTGAPSSRAIGDC